MLRSVTYEKWNPVVIVRDLTTYTACSEDLGDNIILMEQGFLDMGKSWFFQGYLYWLKRKRTCAQMNFFVDVTWILQFVRVSEVSDAARDRHRIGCIETHWRTTG